MVENHNDLEAKSFFLSLSHTISGVWVVYLSVPRGCYTQIIELETEKTRRIKHLVSRTCEMNQSWNFQLCFL